MKVKDLPKLVISIVIPLLAAFIGGIATSSAVSTWYTTLNKPIFTPPNWLFGPVWTVLYILMGLALFFVWKKGVKKAKTAMYLFAVQLILNVLWSFAFFGLNSVLLGLIVIILLLIMIILTMKEFYSISKISFYMFIPYVLWVGFATILNIALVFLNV